MVTDLENLERTRTDYVPKKTSMRWLAQRDNPSSKEVIDSITPEPYKQKGDRFPEPISEVRIKGDAEFVETIAGAMRAFLACEGQGTRLSINLKKVKDRETGEDTDTWSLYLKSVERRKGRRPRSLESIPSDLRTLRR